MYGKQKKLRPKLDRRNAAKNIDYDASLSSSTSLPSSFVDDQSNRRTRSRDLYPVSEHTSFRIKGIDGEFDVICRSLGLSGPEDFAIPAAAWEARKQCSHHSDLYKVDTANELSDTFGNGVRVSVNSSPKNEIEVRASESEDVKCGIKGSRPPRLAHPAPAVDNYASVWELVRGFGPADVEDLGSSLRVESNSDDSEGDERVGETVKNEEERNQAFVRNVSPVSKSSSEITSDDDTFMLTPKPALELEIGGVREEPNDRSVRDAAEDVPQLSSESPSDDSNGLIPEPVYSDSPSGSLRVGIKSWQKGDFLGSGSFGTVHEGFTDDGFFFAVKEVSLLDPGNQGKQSIYQLEQEISLLSQFRHQNIVRYLGTDKVDNKLYIFLELVTKGSLASLYRKYHLRDSQVSVYTRQILSGLHYLHSRNVIHRDIKCANILVDASGSVKLADFGLAKAAKLNDIKSCKGTAFWMAPEVVNGKNNGYGIPADIWSLGCTVLEMLTGQIPYSHLEGMAALFRIGRGEPPPIPNTLSREAQDFIQKCLQVNPNDRPTAAELLEYPFVKNPPSTFSSPAAPQVL